MKTEIRDRTAFLVGAGRSGTTLLYKLLCLHPKVAYISNYENRMPWLPHGLMTRLTAERIDYKRFAWFKAGGEAYFINRPIVKKLFPTPIEGEFIYKSCGIPLLPGPEYSPDTTAGSCLRSKFEKIRQAVNADIMLSKRTANNRRIPIINTIFPHAKYIHLIRDGREVTDSLTKVEWWNNHILWWAGRTPLEMEQAGEERLAVAARNWIYEMEELRKGLSLLKTDQILEVRYEHLLSDPVNQVRSILEFLGLTMIPAFEQAIKALQITYRPGTWKASWNPHQLAIVTREIQPLLSNLGYR